MDNGIQVKRKHIFNINEIINVIDEVKQEFQGKVEGLEMTGSGWRYGKILSLEISIHKYKPLRGSSYIPLDDYLSNKKCCINIQNEDNKD